MGDHAPHEREKERQVRTFVPPMREEDDPPTAAHEWRADAAHEDAHAWYNDVQHRSSEDRGEGRHRSPCAHAINESDGARAREGERETECESGSRITSKRLERWIKGVCGGAEQAGFAQASRLLLSQRQWRPSDPRESGCQDILPNSMPPRLVVPQHVLGLTAISAEPSPIRVCKDRSIVR